MRSGYGYGPAPCWGCLGTRYNGMRWVYLVLCNQVVCVFYSVHATEFWQAQHGHEKLRNSQKRYPGSLVKVSATYKIAGALLHSRVCKRYIVNADSCCSVTSLFINPIADCFDFDHSRPWAQQRISSSEGSFACKSTSCVEDRTMEEVLRLSSTIGTKAPTNRAQYCCVG